MLMSHSPNDISKIKIDGEKLEGLSSYNTGVIVYKNNLKVNQLFTSWNNLYKKVPPKYVGDQPAFMEALLYHDVKIYVLSYVYNFRLPAFISLPPLKVKIIHGRSKNYERLDNIINKHPNNHRTWSPYWGRMFKNYRRFNRSKRIFMKLFGKRSFEKLKNRVK